MEPTPLTPEQQRQVKKAKLTLWLGLGAIMFIGLVIVFYFVFVNKAVAPVVNNVINSNLNANVAANTNTPANVNVVANTNSTADALNRLTYNNESLDISFKYPNGITEPTIKPGINFSEEDPIESWRDILISVDDSYLSFTRREESYGRYESSWNNTYYSKAIDFTQTDEKIQEIIEKDFENILNFKVLTVSGKKFVEFYQLGEYGGDGALLYRTLVPNNQYGDVVGTYVISNPFAQWDVGNQSELDSAVAKAQNDVNKIISGDYDGSAISSINTLRDISGTISKAITTISTSDWLTYENEELGISFDYPAEWGDVQTQKIDNREKNKEAFSGQGYDISFTNYPSGDILFASADYKNFVTFHYNGNSDLSQECKTPGTIQDHSYCINKLVANQNTFDRIFFDAYECSPHFEREVWLNVNQNVYKGIRISTVIYTEGKWDCTSDDQAAWDMITDSELNRLISRESLTTKEKNLLEAMDGFINSIKLR